MTIEGLGGELGFPIYMEIVISFNCESNPALWLNNLHRNTLCQDVLQNRKQKNIFLMIPATKLSVLTIERNWSCEHEMSLFSRNPGIRKLGRERESRLEMIDRSWLFWIIATEIQDSKAFVWLQGVLRRGAKTTRIKCETKSLFVVCRCCCRSCCCRCSCCSCCCLCLLAGCSAKRRNNKDHVWDEVVAAIFEPFLCRLGKEEGVGPG